MPKRNILGDTKKVLFLDEYNSLNNGEMARVMCMVNAIKKYSPNTSFYMLSSSPDIDRRRFKKIKLTVVKRPWFNDNRHKLLAYSYSLVIAIITLIQYFLLRVIGKKGRLHKYDVFIHITGDVFNDRGLVVLLYHLYHILFGLVAQQKVVICAESIGPFKGRLTASLTRTLLNRVDLITVRETISRDQLNTIGVKNQNTFLTADPAFLLKPTVQKFNQKLKTPVLGVNASPDIIPYFSTKFGENDNAKRQKYTKLIAQTIDGFIEDTGGIAILIPHVTRRVSDDRSLNEEIYGKIHYPKSVITITEQYTADEIKEVIGLCDLFIGSRLHATIASTSLGIPTIALAHTHKYHGILGNMLNLEKTVIDIKCYSYQELFTELKSTLDYSLKNRQTIQKNLQRNIVRMKKLAMLNGKLIVSLLYPKRM